MPRRGTLQTASGARLKVTLLFLVSVGIPSVFLLFLAIRGIESDQARAEQRLLSEHRAIADSLITGIDQQIALVEEQLVNTLRRAAGLEGIGARDGLVSSDLIDEVFWLRDGHLVYPFARLLYHFAPDTRTDHVPAVGTGLRDLLDEAEMNEFQLENSARAEELYRSALNRARENDTKADVLMRIARVARRQEAFNRSHDALTAVVAQYNTTRLPGGLPGGVAARLELTGLATRTGDRAGAGRFLTELYRELLAGTWSLTRTQFRFVRGRISTFVTDLTGSAGWTDTAADVTIQQLSAEADSCVSRTDALLDISSTALPMILDSTRAAAEQERRSFRLVVGSGGRQYLLVVARAVGGGRDRIEAAGAIVSAAGLRNTLLSDLAERYSPGDNASLLIRDATGVNIHGTPPPPGSRLTVTRMCTGNFPLWSVALYQDDPDFFAELLSGRRSFYMYALVAVVVALSFGTVMAARMMSRDLELARLKSDFVSTVSHEFRSPLTSIRQLSEMLQSGRVMSEERRQRYYDIIVEQSERLSLLIGNILDLARIDERHLKLDRGRVDMNALLNRIVTRVQQQGHSDGVLVRLEIRDPLPPAFIDPDAITQVLDNLIDNAIKYSRVPARVSISAHVENGDTVVSVADQGIGIPKNEIARIFRRFYRSGEASTRRVKGSGLGLALVQELVHAHGGSVRVTSEVGKGSVFTVRLPLGKDEESTDG